MINVQKDRITFSQIAIFVWGLSILFGCMLFFKFVDGPAASRVLDIQDQVDSVEGRLKWMTQTMDTIQDPERVLAHFREMDRDLQRKFPDSAEKSLLMLTDYANKFGVRIEQIQPELPRKVVNARGGDVGAEGKVCYGVEVSLTFKGEYYNLVKYLDALRKVMPAFLVVRSLSIENGFSPKLKLEGRLDLSLYLLE
ncbi:MAG: hypothetical protein V1882_06580 [Candidatus Omnitrophota bacterium]